MRVIFFGTPEFAVPTLRALLQSRHEVVAAVAQPDRPAGRGLRLRSPAVIELARSVGIPTLQPETIRDHTSLDRIRKYSFDVGVIVAYGKILPSSLLQIPPQGFVNVHGSLLPKYRGAAPVQRAIEQGETSTGVTIMRLDAELDHGPVLAAYPISIAPDERAPSLSRRIAEAGAQELVMVIDGLERGVVQEVEQDHARATYAPKIEKEEGRIDWTASATDLYNKLRAFDPWPGIFTEMNGEILKLTDVRAATGGGAPGEIVAVHDGGIDVATGRGVLQILELQRPGRRPVSAAEFGRGARILPGARFQ